MVNMLMKRLHYAANEYRKRNKFKYCDIRHNGNMVTILWWSVSQSKTSHQVTHDGIKPDRFLRSRFVEFERTEIETQIDILEQNEAEKS